jgi:hypothetical protein
MPRGLVLRGDTIDVLNMGNLRVISFSPAGTPLGTRSVSAAMAGNMFDLYGGDTLLIATQGQHEALAVRRTLDGPVLARYGHPRSPPVTFYMMGEIARTIASGRVPDEMKNETLPLLGCHRDMWLIEQVNGHVTRYALDGTLRATFQLPQDYVEQQTAAFFEANKKARPNMFYALRMVIDAFAANDGLWLSLEGPDLSPPRLVLVDSTAHLAADINVPGLQGHVTFVDGANRCSATMLQHFDSGLVLRMALMRQRDDRVTR